MRELIEKIVSKAKTEELDFLLIGGNALAFYGYPRNTLDIDFLIREGQLIKWEALLSSLGYRKFHSTAAFAQFEKERAIPIDLMIVGESTWNSLSISSRSFDFLNSQISLPAAEHIVALKLHSANSPTRSKPEQDWEDIRQLIRIQDLDCEDEAFQKVILRYGGESSLKRIRSFPDAK